MKKKKKKTHFNVNNIILSVLKFSKITDENKMSWSEERV